MVLEKTTLSGSSNVNYNGREAATFIVNAGTTLNVTGYTQAEAASVLAWKIPGMGEPGGLPSMGSHRVGHY